MEAAPSTASPILPCDFSGTSLLTYSHQWKHRSTNSSIGHAAHRTTTAKNCIDSTVDTGKSKPDDGTIVFGLAFLTEDSITSASRSTAQFWIFGCTSRGEVCVWKGSNNTPSASQGDDDDDDEEYDTNRFTFATSRIAGSISSNTSKAPVLRLQMSPQSSNNAEVLYSCQIVPRANAYWLVVSGDHGVSIFDWETDILPLIRQNEDDPLASSTTTVHTLPRSRQSFQPYPSPLERSNIEVNDFVVHKDVVYGAAGDLFGCYKWDLETAKVVTTYSRYRDHMSQQFNATVRYNPSTPGTPVGGYMHTVTLVPNTNLILTGGEDGIVGMWDIDADQFVDELNVGKGLAEYCTSTSSRPLLGNDSHPNRRSAAAAAAPTVAAKNDDYSDRWISSCVARDENWWIVAGGSNHSVGGHVSTWHGPSRRLVSCVCTRETPQQLALLRDGDIANSNGIGTPSSTLLSVANESYVSYWSNPLVLDSPDRQRVWCNQASGYAIAVSCDGQHIATGGVGSVVDVYEKGTGCSSQLSTR